MGRIGRRSFLRGLTAAGASLLGLLLEACGKGRQRRETQGPGSVPTPHTALTEGAASAPTAHPTFTAGPTAPPPAARAQAADTVLLNGRVITVDPQDTIAQAVAIRDGLIQAVGSNDEVRAFAGGETETIDLAGQSVTPGLVDAHNHLQAYGLMGPWYLPLLPPEVRTMEDIREKLAEHIAQKPAGDWVMGYYWVAEGRLPNRYDLDPVSPDHPIWLLQQGGHYGSANSLALKLAGIDAGTSQPDGGVIELDAQGEPTGVFYNHRAMDVLRRIAPVPSPEMTVDNIAQAQPVFAAEGVTSFHDNNARGLRPVNSYFDADRAGQMQIRGQIHYTLEWPADLDRALKEIEYYQGNGFMRFAGFKFLLDGQFKMAYCHEPHKGVRWDTPTWEPQSYKDAVRALHDTGLQICVHCVGDAAVDLALDAFEEAMNANPRPDPRHRIEHCVLSTSEATRRIRDLGIVVSTQPQFIRLGAKNLPDQIGEARAARAMVTREWLDAGIPVALGSDVPSTPWMLPQITLAGAVTRVTLDDQRFHPEQSITAREALRAHTMGGAYAGLEEDIKGSIEPGKLADLVVWKRDPISSFEPFEGTGPLDIDALTQAIGSLKASMTMVGGKIVYQA